MLSTCILLCTGTYRPSFMHLYFIQDTGDVRDFEWTEDCGRTIPITMSADPDHVTLAEKKRVLKKWDNECKGMSLKSFQRNGGAKLKCANYRARWERDIANGGTIFEKYQAINDFVVTKFTDARKEFKTVTTWNLRQWAIEKADSFTDEIFKQQFKASLSWA